ncbi:MAG: hypothetical protein EBS62_13680 [Betaproteobacteria bacterium]|nr:hypothetical protein [Betaproteobacteria bacterium]
MAIDCRRDAQLGRAAVQLGNHHPASFTLWETSPLSKTVLLTSPSVAIYHLLCTEQSHHQSGFLPQGKHGIALPLEHLEHFLIQTTRLQATRDWYVDVLGMTEGWHPDFKFPVVWLYLGDKDVLHLTEGGPIVNQNRLRYG